MGGVLFLFCVGAFDSSHYFMSLTLFLSFSSLCQWSLLLILFFFLLISLLFHSSFLLSPFSCTSLFLMSDLSILINVSVFVYFDTFSFHVIKCNVYKKKVSMLSFVFLTMLSRFGSWGAGAYPSYIWVKAGSTLG